MVLDIVQLNEMGKELMWLLWKDKLEIEIVVNGRLKRALGRFVYMNNYSRRCPLKIELSKSLLNGHYNLSTIESVLKHELCHYYLYKNGFSGFNDGERRFEEEVLKIGSHSTRTLRYAGEYHECICKTCGRQVKISTSKTLAIKFCNSKKYVSKCCRAEIIYNGCKVNEDKNVEEQKFSVIHKYSNKLSNAMGIASDKMQEQKDDVSKLKIEDVVILKRKKVSQQNVWDAMLLAVEEKSPEKLKLIKQHYPELFNKICLFIGKKRVEYINSVI